MTSPNVERELSLGDAIALAHRELRRLGLTAEIGHHGNGNLRTRSCRLYRDGALVSRGAGKGVGHESVAGALFESIEHHLSEWSTVRYLPDVEEVPVEQLAADPALARDGVIGLLARNFAGISVPCRRYDAARGSGAVWYPVLLTMVGYGHEPVPGDDLRYFTIARYASNSGSAAGATVDEALVHSMCELIERDALSLALIDWYLTGGRPAVRVVDHATLPPLARDVVDSVQVDIGDEVVLLDVTSDIGVPVLLAAPRHGTWPVRPVGSGASLSAEYAVRRAATELLQLHHLNSTGNFIAAGREVIAELAPYPKYRDCARLDVGALLEHADVETVGVTGDLDPRTRGGLAGYRDVLLDRLEQAGLGCFVARNDPPDSHIACVSTLVPGCERFNVVRDGLVVLPAGRGADRLPIGRA